MRYRWSRPLAVVLAAAPLGLALLAAAAPATDPAAAFAAETAAWRRERTQGLQREGGWLSLVGLFWLHEGENRFGSAAGNTVIFPEGTAPAVAGTLERRGEQVTVHAAPGAGLSAAGKPVTDLLLQRGDEHSGPTELALGSLRFFIIYRGDRVGVRVKDLKSPALAAFKGLDNWPARLDWRFDATFEPYKPAKKVPIPNILGQVEDNDSPGALVFEKDGRTYRLDALEGGKDGSLFVIFGDQTNGHESYGAGRFLDTPPPQDGKVALDFNRAYNPPCAFTAFATCPLPPQQNKLALKVEAGEKNYGAGHH